MLLDRILSDSTGQAAELSARFAEQRQRLLAENIANIDTPDYQSRQLDPAAFETSLREALAAADERAGPASRLELRGNAQVSTHSDGSLAVNPEIEPAPNALFHDGTNARLERLTADAAQNQMQYELATSFLRQRLASILQAIRGRPS
ncbi:Flagellar basal body rod protein FlgB [Phycisphaerae bacterium RAS1]|nr:Flagellar basal body rod protein FlgB [Phycisphaerae bacterium RAS1]